MTQITVQPGDTLTKLAAAHLGDWTRWTWIYRTNFRKILEEQKRRGWMTDEPERWIFPGMVLDLPAYREGEGPSDPPAEALIRRHAEARRDRLDALARLIFADRAILLDDPLGTNIPKNLWERYLPQAVAIMLIMRRPEE